MGALSIYNSSKPDLREEIEAAKTNPLEPSKQHRHFISKGIKMSDPEWDAAPLAPLLQTMLAERDFGSAYDYLPDKLSYDLYGTHELWQVLLRVNSAMGRHDFVGPRFKFIKESAVPTLLDILRFGATRAERENLNGIELTEDLTVRTVFA